MANKFKQGDVVVLKSGGVPMTIGHCPGEELRGTTLDRYICQWQKGATPEQHQYGEQVLEMFVAPKKS